MNYQENLNKILSELNPSDLESLESLEHVSDEEYLEHLSEKVEHLAKANPRFSRLASVLKNNSAQSIAPKKGAWHPDKFKATFTISITRKITVGTTYLTDGSANPVNLPAPIFLVSDYDSQYQNTVVKYLPNDGSVYYAGMTYTSDKNSVVLTYQNAKVSPTIVETITISLLGRSYVTTVNATRTLPMVLTYPKVRIDNANAYNQFSQPYYLTYKSGLTVQSDDFFMPSDYEPPILPNYQLRDVPADIKIDNERGLCPLIIPYYGTPANGSSWTTQITMFLKHYDKISEFHTMGGHK